MNDLECPYCDAPNEVCHDGGQGYEGDKAHEMTCGDCGKNFVFQTSISFYYSPEKADCLNGSPHRFGEWRKMWLNAKHEEIQDRRCKDCDHTERRTVPNSPANDPAQAVPELIDALHGAIKTGIPSGPAYEQAKRALTKASNLQRLVRCVWHLGWDLGWQYWRLQNACIVDPGLALRIAEQAEQDAEMYRRAAAGAREVDSWKSCTRAAEANELWAARARECHAEYSATAERICVANNTPKS